MVDYPFEFLDALPGWQVAFGGKTSGENQIPRFGCAAIGCLDVPTTFLRVESGASHDTLESGVALDVENFVAVVEIVAKFLVVGIVGGPGIT